MSLPIAVEDFEHGGLLRGGNGWEELRHDMRNKFAAIVNATYYLRRRLRDSDAWRADPRIAEFFTLIDNELAAADRLLSERMALHLLGDEPRLTRLGDCVERACAERRGGDGDGDGDVRIELRRQDTAEIMALDC